MPSRSEAWGGLLKVPRSGPLLSANLRMAFAVAASVHFQNGGEVIMQQLKIFALTAILFFSATVARADKVTADYDHTVNFGKFKTFMWIHDSEVSIPFMKDRVMRSVSQKLAARGLREVSDGADL